VRRELRSDVGWCCYLLVLLGRTETRGGVFRHEMVLLELKDTVEPWGEARRAGVFSSPCLSLNIHSSGFL